MFLDQFYANLRARIFCIFATRGMFTTGITQSTRWTDEHSSNSFPSLSFRMLQTFSQNESTTQSSLIDIKMFIKNVILNLAYLIALGCMCAYIKLNKIFIWAFQPEKDRKYLYVKKKFFLLSINHIAQAEILLNFNVFNNFLFSFKMEKYINSVKCLLYRM